MNTQLILQTIYHLLVFSFLFFLTIPAFAKPIPYRTLRYKGVVGQTDFYTCGPAAVATLLKNYYGLKTSEAEILELSIKAMEGTGKDPTKSGFLVLTLKQALSNKNIQSKVKRITPQALTNHFLHKGGLPIILQVTKPEGHYVAAIGMLNKDWIVLADPSFGRRIIRLNTLVNEKGFNGVTLTPMQPRNLGSYIKNQQNKALESAENHLNRLSRLRQNL